MSLQRDRLRQRELLRQLPRELYGPACALEPYLRDAGGPTGLCRCTPQLLAVEVGLRGAKLVSVVLQAIADLRPDGPDKPALGIYDPDLFVWYWAGHVDRCKPRHADEAASRWEYAHTLPDSPARQACLDDLRPYYEALVVKPGAKAARKAAQGELPLPEQVTAERQSTKVEWRHVVDEWIEAWHGTSVTAPPPEGLRQMGSLLTQAAEHEPGKGHWRLMWRTARRLAKRGRLGLELRAPGLAPVPCDLRTVLATPAVYDWLREQAYLPEPDETPADFEGASVVSELTSTLAGRMARSTGPPGQGGRRVVYEDG
jgi:hypothetical protein